MANARDKTTNYWCKHCKVFVRDSPLERRNHEASPRHQGALQRFLKGLYKTNERETREAQRAKDEVARLNGINPGGSSSGSKDVCSSKRSSTSGGPPRQATMQDRKAQMAQLAAMGVVVPQEFRTVNAMAGEWETVAVHPAARPPLPRFKKEEPQPTNVKKEESEEDNGTGLGGAMEMERKRKFEDDEVGGRWTSKSRAKPNWGSDVRTYGDEGADEDLDALLAGSTAAIGRKAAKEGDAAAGDTNATSVSGKRLAIKKEDSRDAVVLSEPAAISEADTMYPGVDIKNEEDAEDLGSLFKKRKKRGLRND